MAKTDYTSIDDYHKAFSGEALELMQQIRVLVDEVATNMAKFMSFLMVEKVKWCINRYY